MTKYWKHHIRKALKKSMISQYIHTSGHEHGTKDFLTVWDGWNGIYNLWTFVLLSAGLYYLYQHAVDHEHNINRQYNHSNLKYQGRNYHLITDLRLGSNRYFPFSDASPYLVPDELDGLEHTLKEMLGDFVFADEYTSCAACGEIIRTSPDSYGWRPDCVFIDDDGYIHADCLTEDDLQDWMDEHKGHTIPYAINQKFSGYTTIEIPKEHRKHSYDQVFEYESGFHHGQDDDPKKMTTYLSDHGIDVWFEYTAGQFDIVWRPMVRQADHDKAHQLLIGFDTY